VGYSSLVSDLTTAAIITHPSATESKVKKIVKPDDRSREAQNIPAMMNQIKLAMQPGGENAAISKRASCRLLSMLKSYQEEVKNKNGCIR
jgi:hypothetical protein